MQKKHSTKLKRISTFNQNTFFNWSVIDLQCCVSFCCTMKWISSVCTRTSSFLNSPHIPLSRSSWNPELNSLGWAPRAVMPASCRPLFHTRQCVCPCSSLSSSHPLLPPASPNTLWNFISNLKYIQDLTLASILCHRYRRERGNSLNFE